MFVLALEVETELVGTVGERKGSCEEYDGSGDAEGGLRLLNAFNEICSVETGITSSGGGVIMRNRGMGRSIRASRILWCV